MFRAAGTRLTAFAFAAGAAVLAAEVVWSRSLLVLLGGSVDASAAVLSAVMAGFALGSGYFGRLGRSPHATRILRTAVLLAAASSLLPAVLADPLRSSWPSILSLGLPPAAARAASGFLLVFPSCFFAGGALPLMSSLAEAMGGGTERASGLYAANSAGSALGGLAAGFVLLEAIGSSSTLLLSAAMLAACAFLVPSVPARADARERAAGAPGGTGLVCVLYGASGAIALAWECVWARQLTYLLGNSTYAFCLMSSAALGGMALGAWAGRGLWRNLPPLASFGAVEAALASCALLPLACTAILPASGLAGLRIPVLRDLAWNGAALLSMIPATAFMGATFPAALRAAVRPGSLGPSVGRLAMANGLGAAAGPFLASRLLFPLSGVTASASVLAVGGAGLAAAAGLASGRRRTALAGALPLLLAASAPILFRAPGSRPPSGDLELRMFDEDRTATVAVFGREWDGYLSLRINGVEEVPIDQASLEAFYLLGNLPWGYDPGARSALVIAYGAGMTAGALLSHPLDTLVCVELCPAVVRASQLFSAYNGRPDLDSRFHLVGDDGRNFVAGSSRPYDLIVCDATHPGSADSWVLYTREFYEDVLSRLAPGGVAAQWVPLHSLPLEDFRRIINTWSTVFPYCALHLAGGRHAVLIGSGSPLELHSAALFDTPRAASMLRSVAYDPGEPERLSAVASDDELRRPDIAASGLNTDDRAPCQFIRRRAPRDPQVTIAPDASFALSLGGLADELFYGQLLYWQTDLPGAVRAFRQAGGSALARRWLAVSLTTAAERLEAGGDPEGALTLLSEAIAADPSWPRASDLEGLVRGELPGGAPASR